MEASITADVEYWRRSVVESRSRLSELEEAYAAGKSAIEAMLAVLFSHLKRSYQKRAELQLTVEHRTKQLASLRNGQQEAAVEMERRFKEAKARLDKDYEEAEAALIPAARLTGDEETELLQLWKRLVKLYHPDRFAQKPGTLETYEKLTSAINQAKDNGDLHTLRDIADDPNNFLLSQGRTVLGLNEEEELGRLRQLFESTQLEIVAALESLNKMHESPDYELSKLVEEKPGWLSELLEERGRQLNKEIAELERQATQIARKLQELSRKAPTTIA